MTSFIDTIMEENSLKSLNISFNNCNQPPKEDDSPFFDNSFSEFLHTSLKLVYLDISGTNLTMDSLLYIAQWGFRKSRTLQVIHITDMNLLNS